MGFGPRYNLLSFLSAFYTNLSLAVLSHWLLVFIGLGLILRPIETLDWKMSYHNCTNYPLTLHPEVVILARMPPQQPEYSNSQVSSHKYFCWYYFSVVCGDWMLMNCGRKALRYL